MHYLVTGGAGFIGSHLAEFLMAQGEQVTVIDDLSTGHYRNIASLEGQPHFRFIKDTVLHAPLIERLVREADAVFHLASAVGVRLIMERPVHTIESIFNGTEIVLRMAARYRRKVLLTSTSEVYGKSDTIPFREDGDRLEGPTHKHRWAYACAKALDEFLALAHWKESGLPVVVTRLFNTVGPRQTGQYGMVLPTFVQAALRKDTLTVYGDGQQTRCFCHVADVVEALAGLMVSEAANGQVVNVGSDEEVTIEGLAQRVQEQVGISDGALRFVPYNQVYGEDFEDMRRRVPALDRVYDLIQWKPRFTLRDIIDDVIADQQELLAQRSIPF